MKDLAVITYHPVDSTDEAFLYRLYASGRTEEMSNWGWDNSQQEAFLTMQFRAQRSQYDQYPNVSHRIILANDHPIGRLIVSEVEDELRLVDIMLLAEHRNAGIGTILIRELLDRATSLGKAVRLHVEKTNRAQRLYQRLGFVITAEKGSHYLMQWRA
ncbi:MAG TPA: GNAT family N-acetyltransferase [Blastocatellia bacterium]|nr:GNAT family N-acetyltransferase [Blastocatellia bacterium]